MSRQGIVVCGEDSESEEEICTKEVHYPVNVNNKVLTPSESSRPATAVTRQLELSLLHVKLEDSKQRLQRRLQSCYLLPLQQQQHTLQFLHQRAISGTSALVRAQNSLTSSISALDDLDRVLANMPRHNFSALK